MAGTSYIGRELGRYRIQSIIGSGGFATVYRALDTALERTVALKVVDPAAHHNPTVARRFAREGQAVASLDHPAVVPVYDAGEHDGILWLAMRLIEGGSLDDALRVGRRLSADEIVAVVARIGGALDHAHASGLVHRDVKPSNILLEENDPRRAWLADFGIAATARTMGQYTTGALGTAAYMAPEQARPGEAGPAADLYSLACVAFEMITGARPYPGEDYVALLMAHVNDPVPPTGHAAIDELMARALAKDPARRPSSGAALAVDLRRALDTGVGTTAVLPFGPGDATQPYRPFAANEAPAAPPPFAANEAPAAPPPLAAAAGAPDAPAAPGSAAAASPPAAAPPAAAVPSPPAGAAPSPAAVPSPPAGAAPSPATVPSPPAAAVPFRAGANEAPAAPPPFVAAAAAAAPDAPGAPGDEPPKATAAGADPGGADAAHPPAGQHAHAAAAEAAAGTRPAPAPGEPPPTVVADPADRGRAGDPDAGRAEPPPTLVEQRHDTLLHPDVHRPPPPAPPPRAPAGPGQPGHAGRPPGGPPGGPQRPYDPRPDPPVARPAPPVNPGGPYGPPPQAPSSPQWQARREPTVERRTRRRGLTRLAGGTVALLVAAVATFVTLQRRDGGTVLVTDAQGIEYRVPSRWEQESESPVTEWADDGTVVATVTNFSDEGGLSATDAVQQLVGRDGTPLCEVEPGPRQVQGATDAASCANPAPATVAEIVVALGQGQQWVVTVHRDVPDGERADLVESLRLFDPAAG